MMLRWFCLVWLIVFSLTPRMWAQWNTQQVSQQTIGGSSETLDREGNLVAVAHHQSGCTLVDVSNAASPLIVSTVSPDALSQDIWDVDIHGDYLYLMNRPEAVDSQLGNWVGMYIYDISNPVQPVLTGTILWGSAPWHHLGGSISAGTVVEMGNQTVAIVCSDISSGVEIFDVSNPALPVFVASIYSPTTWASSWDVQVQNQKLFTAWGSGGFTIHDLGNLASPSLIVHQPYLGASLINGGVRTVSPTADGQRVLTGEYTFDGDVRLWNIASLPTSQTASQWRSNSGALLWTVRTTDHFAYVAHLESGVQVLDLRQGGLQAIGTFDPDPASPRRIWAGISDIQVDGNRVYACHETDGLYVFDFGDQVQVEQAEYRVRKRELVVWATSSDQPNVGMSVDGLGPMQWNARRGRYELSLRTNNIPSSVVVRSSLTGEATATVVAR